MLKHRLFLFVLCFTATALSARDSLSVSHLQPVTYYLQLSGNGTSNNKALSFLRTEAKNNQFIVLGEYHGSQRISEFTEFFIPIYHAAGCRFLALEVGPVSVTFLEKFADENPAKTIENLKRFNTSWHYTSKNRTYTAIPFFSHVSDARFLSVAGQKNWRLYGLDQEFKYGFIPLLEHAFSTIPKARQAALQKQHQSALDTLSFYYQMEMEYYRNKPEGAKRFFELLHESAFLKGYFKTMRSASPRAAEIITAIERSIEIYRNNTIRKYWESNTLRTENFITNFRKSLSNFDVEADKMLIKIGGLHAARGMNNYSMYDIGNTVAELARLHGNSSLHVCFLSRFERKGGVLKDALQETESWYTKSFASLFQMGRKDQWTIIDLRPLRENMYYRRKFLVNDRVKEYFDRYDVLIITPAEEEPQINLGSDPQN